MIVNHKHKFIFLKNHKTAGTAIEISLSRYCGESDILTELGPRFETKRRAVSPIGAQNHRFKKTIMESHSSCAQIYDYVGHRIWNTYAKIIVERHPYQRYLSQYYMDQLENSDGMVSFEDWVFNPKWRKSRTRNTDKIFFGNSIGPDFFIKYESLATDLSNVLGGLGVDWDGWIPRERVGIKKDQSLLTGPVKERIYTENKFLFEFLKYKR